MDSAKKTVAVILSGCGHLDGAEIRESVLSLLVLDISDINYRLFSIDSEQYHVINHLTGEVMGDESRNVLVESARIARGEISDIKELEIDDFDGLLIPGGFGVAKNLSTFAFDGHKASLNADVQQVIQDFHAKSKPIGAICIAPAILAVALGDKLPTLTIGTDEGTANELAQLGAKHSNCMATDCVCDEANKLVSTPAYMQSDASLKEIYQGISAVVKKLVELM